jgi:hypothetical protein
MTRAISWGLTCPRPELHIIHPLRPGCVRFVQHDGVIPQAFAGWRAD